MQRHLQNCGTKFDPRAIVTVAFCAVFPFLHFFVEFSFNTWHTKIEDVLLSSEVNEWAYKLASFASRSQRNCEPRGRCCFCPRGPQRSG